MTELRKEIQQQRQEIKALASRIRMRYQHEHLDEDCDVIVGNNWTRTATNVESVQCSLSSDRYTVLNVRFSKGGRIDKHYHPLRREEIFVIEGEIYDSVNDVHVTQGHRYVIPAGIPHQIESDYAMITVVFRPPYPKVSMDEDLKSSSSEPPN